MRSSGLSGLLSGLYRVGMRFVAIRLLMLRAHWLRLVWGNDEAAFLISRVRKHAVAPLLRTLGASVAADADLEPHLIIHNARDALRNLHIGEACHIGKTVFLDLAAPIRLEAHVTISMKVTLLTHMDVGRTPLRDSLYPTAYGPITIGEGAYIGAGATILHGVTIGRYAVVAAGAVVRADVPEFTMVGGVPARPIKQLAAADVLRAADST